MNNYWICIVCLIIVGLIILNYTKRERVVEGYNDQTGRFCMSCRNRNRNCCLSCFNCGWCEDQWGNGKCIGGDNNSGPYNYERCAKWTHGDPFHMVSKKQNLRGDPSAVSLTDCLGTGMKPKVITDYPKVITNYRDPRLASYDYRNMSLYPQEKTGCGSCGDVDKEITGLIPKNIPRRHVNYSLWGEMTGMMPKRTANAKPIHKGYNSCGNPVRDNYCLLQ